MTQFELLLPFAQSNWIWILLLLGVAAYYIFFEVDYFRYRPYMKTPQEIVQLINKENAQILDLRPKNFFETSHISGALNLDGEALLKEKALIKFDKDRPLVLFSGYESDGKKVLKAIQDQGFEKIYILSGGAQEWKKLNYPFVSSKVEKKNSKKKKVSSK